LRRCAARAHKSCNLDLAGEAAGALSGKEIVMAGKATKTAGSGKLHIKWVRSAICSPVKHKLVVKGLGFTRLNQVIERPDTPAIRGMVKKIPHLVEIVQQ
jgi:large subunit ribosomal protein L30